MDLNLITGRHMSWDGQWHTLFRPVHKRSNEILYTFPLVSYITIISSLIISYLWCLFSVERTCSKDITYDGIHIPKGMIVSVDIHSLHHSEEYYTNPETFNTDRYFEIEKTGFRFNKLIKCIVGGLQRIRPSSIHMLTCPLEWVLVIVWLCVSAWKKSNWFYASWSKSSISSQLKKLR